MTIEQKTIIDLHQVSGVGDEAGKSLIFSALYYKGIIYFVGRNDDKYVEHDRIFYEIQRLGEEIEEENIFGGSVIARTTGYGFRVSPSTSFQDKIPYEDIKKYDKALIDYLRNILQKNSPAPEGE